MEVQPQDQEHLATVIPFPQQPEVWPVERINGIKLPLGRMSLDELLQVEQHCLTRASNARMDALIVRDFIDIRFPDGPEGS